MTTTELPTDLRSLVMRMRQRFLHIKACSDYIPASVTTTISGRLVKIDQDDIDELGMFTWHVTSLNGQLRLRCHLPPHLAPTHSSKKYLLYRLIAGALPGEVVDHINGDTLDNTKLNLRIATQSQNSRNRAVKSSCRTGFRGVSIHKTGGMLVPMRTMYRASLRLPSGEHLDIGYFDSAEDAAHAYDKAALVHIGQFARFNFPKPERVVQPTEATSAWLTISDLSKLVCMPEQALRNMASSGKLNALKIGRKWKFPASILGSNIFSGHDDTDRCPEHRVNHEWSTVEPVSGEQMDLSVLLEGND